MFSEAIENIQCWKIGILRNKCVGEHHIWLIPNALISCRLQIFLFLSDVRKYQKSFISIHF